MILFEVAIDGFVVTLGLASLLYIVVVERRFGPMVTVLFELGVDRLMDVVVDCLFTLTGLVILVVLDELIMLLGLVVDCLYVVEDERLLTVTEPGLVLGPM